MTSDEMILIEALAFIPSDADCVNRFDGARAPWPFSSMAHNPKLPPALEKACGDPFDYVLKLRTGEIIRFSEAEIHGDYATLTIHGDSRFAFQHQGQPLIANPPSVAAANFCFERDIEVRIEDIVWCADAPHGS